MASKFTPDASLTSGANAANLFRKNQLRLLGPPPEVTPETHIHPILLGHGPIQFLRRFDLPTIHKLLYDRGKTNELWTKLNDLVQKSLSEVAAACRDPGVDKAPFKALLQVTR